MQDYTLRPVLNAEECAELLRCCTDTVEEMSRSGELPGVKFGRGWIYVTSDLLAYLAEKARREAEERRAGLTRPASSVEPIHTKVKPQRRTPPALPVPPTTFASSPQRGNLRSVAP